MAEYISKEAVLNHLNECKEDPLFDPDMARICFAISIFIEDMQAADVQPVKHGKWSECYTDSHHYSGICSVCGRASIKSLTESLYEYCPRCGARMIKGGEIDE